MTGGQSLALLRALSALALAVTLALPSSPVSAQNPGTETDQADDWGGDDWGDDQWDDDAWSDDAGSRWSGFAEVGLGWRLVSNPTPVDDLVLGDARLRAETEWLGERLNLGFKADLLYDEVGADTDFDLRELALSFSPAGSVDLKLGRQVLTWGTGDFLFLNDLFPKDWVSFFNGRDDEYLKAPSDTVRLNWFTDVANLDLAWTPVFEPDNYIDGERFSFFSPQAGTVVAPRPPVAAVLPNESLGNGELALRLHRRHEATEYALYAYRGFTKSPEAADSFGRPTFSRLDAYGASLRTTLFRGLFNAETAYYASRDDRSGDDPAIPNSQARFLVGYEQELVANLTFAGQGYVEWIENHDRLLAASPTPGVEPEKWRTLLTSRLTWRTRQDKLIWSLFGFYSPTEHDGYVRPKLDYRYSDQWTLTAGLNLFTGDEAHTFFGQFDDNDNAYVRVRFNY